MPDLRRISRHSPGRLSAKIPAAQGKIRSHHRQIVGVLTVVLEEKFGGLKCFVGTFNGDEKIRLPDVLSRCASDYDLPTTLLSNQAGIFHGGFSAVTRASDHAHLDFVRCKQILQTTLVDLNALISNTSQMLRRLIGEDIQLVTTLAADLAPVRADIGQLEQIVINLAVNARDAMPGGGRLSIETANVELDDSYALQHVVVRPGRYVMLAVSDSGAGMDEETKRRLFEPFFTTKEPGKGTGLGLSTVYGIVKQSEGYVWVYSEPGKGAAFKVYLPQAEGAAEAAGTLAPKTLASGGSEKVLVVEDEEAVRYLTRALLERSGYRVVDAANPHDAEAVFNEQTDSIDLLITDVVMPGSSGPALFKRLAERQPGLKVLYMSGYTDSTIIREGRLDTGGTFMQKPFTGDGLVRKVREVLDR